MVAAVWRLDSVGGFRRKAQRQCIREMALGKRWQLWGIAVGYCCHILGDSGGGGIVLFFSGE